MPAFTLADNRVGERQMEKKHVIIPSAVLVPDELQYLGKLPAVIYPVNQRIVFDYLYAQYKDIASSIRVVCGQGREKVHDRLARYVSQGKLILEDLPTVKDLGYTVQYGIRNITEPIIVNFGDTVVDDATLAKAENAGGGTTMLRTHRRTNGPSLRKKTAA